MIAKADFDAVIAQSRRNDVTLPAVLIQRLRARCCCRNRPVWCDCGTTATHSVGNVTPVQSKVCLPRDIFALIGDLSFPFRANNQVAAPAETRRDYHQLREVLCERIRKQSAAADIVKSIAAGPIPLTSPTRRCDRTAPTK